MDTKVWKAAFDQTRQDASAEEQARLSGCYGAMRLRAAALVAKISADLPHMTIHDVKHLDALWEMASIACGDQVDLNPAEAFVFGGAVLLHDAAMSLAAFPGGLAEVKQTMEWRDSHARHAAASRDGVAVSAADLEERATADALRLLHAKQAENLPKTSWPGPNGENMFLIEDQQVRNFYGPKIGRIAYSHWWTVSRVEEELSGTLGALAGVTSCTVDLLKVACLLRVADAMHLDQRRAPAFDHALTRPTGVSANHWAFQERMAKPFVQGDALVYTAQPPFEVKRAEAWWTAFDALQMVDRELRDVDRVLRDRQKTPLVIRRVEGAHTPSELSRSVETIGWTPIDSRVRVTDVPKIVATLGGSKLYGSGTAAPVRELIQNGLDAITARRRLQSRPSKWGELLVALEQRDDGHWLCVEDNGVGMSTAVLTGPLVDFGNSLWRSSMTTEEFPGLASAGMKARGKYGIGFFSVFMLGDHVRVVTRRYDRDIRSAKVLEFRNGLASRPILMDVGAEQVPVDGGTRVEVRLRNAPAEPDGLLFRQEFHKGTVSRFEEVIASVAPAVDVAITILHDGTIVGSIGAEDWTEIKTSRLLKRISLHERRTSGERTGRRLTELRDEEGRIYGRARIEADDLWLSSGLITVDGLASATIGLVSGILVGVEDTASRNSATPTVPAPVLASWASEQAITVANSEVPEVEKAKTAELVLACGGNPAKLPIVWWRGEWMSSGRLRKAVGGVERFALHKGDISHDDDDDVTKREFEAWFEQKTDIARTVGNAGRSAGEVGWIASVVKGNGRTPVAAIRDILIEVWGGAEYEGEVVVVGESNGTEILRSVVVYSRVEDQQDAEAG